MHESQLEWEANPCQGHGIILPVGRGHISEAAFFDELAEVGEAAPSWPRGVLLPAWEDPEGQSPSLTTLLPRLPDLLEWQQPDDKKRYHRGYGSLEKVCLPDEQTAYTL